MSYSDWSFCFPLEGCLTGKRSRLEEEEFISHFSSWGNVAMQSGMSQTGIVKKTLLKTRPRI